MKISTEELEKSSEKALRSCLARVPFIRIQEIKRTPGKESVRPDFLVQLALPDGKQNLVVEVKNSGQPRLAREAINQLLRFRDIFSGSYGVFMAPYISPRAGEICDKENIGYIDLSGNCRLCFGQVYIEEEGKPNLIAKKRDLRSLYSPKAERVLRVLSNNPGESWKIKELADEARVSLGQVANVKKLLIDREWVRTKREGFVLGEPEQLLKEWAENYTYRRNVVRDYYSLKTVAEVEGDLSGICNQKGVMYALTSFSAAARLAPAVKYQRAFAYVEKIEEELVFLLNLKEVPSGANVSLLSPYDEGVFYGVRMYDKDRIVSPVQIYLDLFGFRGRGEEAARALLDQVIRPQW